MLQNPNKQKINKTYHLKSFNIMEKRKVKRKTITVFYWHLLIMLLFCSQSAISIAQEQKISIALKNSSLHEILMEVKKQSGKNIVFNNNLIDQYKNETITIKNVSIEEALKKALEGKKLKFRVVDNVIVIEPADPDKRTQLNNDPGTGKTQIIRGQIIDKSTEMPIPGATILVNDSTSPQVKGTTSDTEGYFKIENIPVGRVNVQVSFVGYNPVKIDNVLLRSGKEMFLNIELEESVIELKEIAVTYRKDKAINDMASVSARAFSVEETEKYAGSLGDPARMATNFAGVSTAGDQRNDIIIRGNSPTGLLWQLEDIPIPSPNHFDVNGTTGGPVSMLNNNLLSRSDFFTSAFPAEYGNATSGVFDLKMRNGNNEKHEFLAQASLYGFEAGAEGPISKNNKSSYIINARYSMLGLVQDLLWVTGLPQYQDVSFKVNFPLKSGKLSVFGLGGTSSYTEIDEDDKRSNSTNEYATKSVSGSKTGLVGANYMHNLNQSTTIKTALAFSRRGPEEVIDSALNDNVYLHLDNNSYKQTNITLTSKLIKKFNAKNTATIGVVLQDFSFDASRMVSYYDDSLLIGKPYSVSQNNLLLLQGFVEWQHKFSDVFSINTGINTLYFQYNQTSAIDPRVGLTWKLNEKQTFGLGYGLHSQMQPVNVYFIQSKTGIDANGMQVYSDLKTNKNLDFTRSNQFVISHNYSFNQNLRLKTEAYYQYLFQVPVKTSKGYFSMINFGAAQSVPEEDNLVNEGRGKNYGIEFTFEKFLSNNYYFLITSSIFDSKYQGADKIWRNTAYNGHYVFNVLGGYEFELKKDVLLNTNLRTVYAGGRRIIPFDPVESEHIQDTKYIYDQAYERQVADYFRLDFRIGIILQKKKATHEFAFDISNLTNHKNVYREKYNKTYYHQGIFPMGLYRLNF
jgi:hypothetical protein